jgi:hypothetical protein
LVLTKRNAKVHTRDMPKTRPDRDNRTGSEQYAGFMKRILRSYGKKAAAGDLDITALEQLRELREMLDGQTAEVVRALRTEEGGAHSWDEIGRALGITRSAAYRKYGGDEADARKPGGQPGRLR